MTVPILILVVTAASVTDCLTHRIPNWLCLVALTVGLALQAGAAEPPGIVAMSASVVVPFLLFIPFYAGGGMAAGDVKLMASCGALLGWPHALLASGCALLAGTVMGIGVYVYRGGWKSFAARYGGALKVFGTTGSFFIAPAGKGSVAASRFPYALAIAFGCVAGGILPSLR